MDYKMFSYMMGVKIINFDLIITLVLSLVHCAYTEHILHCKPNVLDTCPGIHQICNETSEVCDCAKGFVRVGDECEAPNALSNNDATVAIATTFTIVLIICGLVLVIRRYNLVEYMRQKIHARRNNDVMYEDVMIGQDDPPINP